jgi:hypothetical protein
MKTEDLIRALAEDRKLTPGVGNRLLLALPLAFGVAAVTFLATMNLRSGMGQFEVARAVGIKLAVTLPLAFAGVFLAWRALEPGRRKLPVWMLMVPVASLAVALVWDLSRFGLDQFSTRLFGHNYLACVMAIPLLSALPLAGMLWAFRHGAPTAPADAGLLTGVGAAGLGASLYALHCPDDSPFFILAWYSLAALIMAGAGRAAGRRLLAW